MDAKFCVESDFTGPHAANCRNLEDCCDLTRQVRVFSDPVFSRKIGAPCQGSRRRSRGRRNKLHSNISTEWNSDWKSQNCAILGNHRSKNHYPDQILLPICCMMMAMSKEPAYKYDSFRLNLQFTSGFNKEYAQRVVHNQNSARYKKTFI